MTTIRQAADQLAQALRDLYENGANCPDDKVLRARDAYDAACAQPLIHECGERCFHASDCAVHNAPAYPVGECDCGGAKARVEELERTLSAYRQAITEAKARNTGQIGANYGPDWILSYARELLK